jgi:hypothetical protein
MLPIKNLNQSVLGYFSETSQVNNNNENNNNNNNNNNNLSKKFVPFFSVSFSPNSIDLSLLFHISFEFYYFLLRASNDWKASVILFQWKLQQSMALEKEEKNDHDDDLYQVLVEEEREKLFNFQTTLEVDFDFFQFLSSKEN